MYFFNFLKIEQIKLDRNTRTKAITYQTNGELDIKEDSHLASYLTHEFVIFCLTKIQDNYNNCHVLTINIPEDHQERVEGNILVHNSKTDQKEKLNIVYDMNTSIFDNVNISLKNSSDVGITDALVMLVCMFLLYIAFKTAMTNGKKNDEFNDNILNSRSNYNTVYGSH